MNFSPFGVGVPISAVPVATQFSGKLTQNVTTANGQVVGVLQGGENGVHYIRPIDTSSFAQATQQQNQTPTVITLPITMPGAKPGDPQQTVQIQVVNPVSPITTMTAPATSSASSPKYQISQIPIQTFGQGATVLTVAYNSNQEGIQIVDGQNIPEGMTVIAALQPADLQMLQQQGITTAEEGKKEIMTPVSIIKTDDSDEQNDTKDGITMQANYIQTTTSVQEYLQRIQAQGLTQFLKFNTDIKREQITEDGVIETVSVVEAHDGVLGEEYVMHTEDHPMEGEEPVEEDDKNKKKKKYKKKPPKPKKPKPGQVHIATALDGTTLFCCPECHMAYPEKELLEQHLVGHKIERRFICDICGAGLKRKEHLERHKLGHNPERPFVCSVCMKGFKRKEHLNLHFVIHSGQKTEVCDECGKGFYRKDHLRKHARSHVTRRAKEAQAQLQAQEALAKQQAGESGQQVTIQVKVPTSQTPIQIPVQIQVPQQHLQVSNEQHLQVSNEQHLQVSTAEGEVSQVSTVVLPTSPESISILPD